MLEGQKIVVTGGAGVLGRAVAETVVAHGGQVLMLDVADQFDSALGVGHVVDLTDAGAVNACIEGLGSFDGLANIAGGFDMGPTVYETDDAVWDAMFDINVRTLRYMLNATVPAMLQNGGGSIVNIGAFGALRGTGHMGAYTAAKSTVMRLTEALSEEVRSQGINVNAVLPSLIDTPRNRADMPEADFSTWVSPTDLAQVICFLLSKQARAVHGRAKYLLAI